MTPFPKFSHLREFLLAGIAVALIPASFLWLVSRRPPNILAGMHTAYLERQVTQLRWQVTVKSDSLELTKAAVIVNVNEKQTLRDSIVTLHLKHNEFALSCK